MCRTDFVKRKMLAGELYRPDAELLADQADARDWMTRYNAASGASDDERRLLLRERLQDVGEGAVIRPPFHCDTATTSRWARALSSTSTASFSMWSAS